LWFNFATLEGLRVYDQSGKENHGTIYGARWLRGPIGGRLSFDGVDDKVDVPDDPSLDLTDEMTLEAFVKPLVAGFALVIAKHEIDYGYRFMVRDFMLEADVWDSTGARRYKIGGPVP